MLAVQQLCREVPFSSTDDPLLKYKFLKCFEYCLTSIKARPGISKISEKLKMPILSQTYKGLKITVFSVTEVLNVLIIQGFIYAD